MSILLQLDDESSLLGLMVTFRRQVQSSANRPKVMAAQH